MASIGVKCCRSVLQRFVLHGTRNNLEKAQEYLDSFMLGTLSWRIVSLSNRNVVYTKRYFKLINLNLHKLFARSANVFKFIICILF